MHYDKALKILNDLTEPKEYLQVLLEKVGLLEYQSEQSTSNILKIRHLEAAFKQLQESHKIIKDLKEMKMNESENENEIKNFLKIFEQRLQIILKNLIKFIILKKDEIYNKKLIEYKKIYGLTLTKINHDNICDMIKNLDAILDNMKLYC